MFEQFGFRGFGNQQRNDRERKTPDVEMPMRLNLKQLYLGEVIELDFVRETMCLNWKECTKKSQDCQGPGIKVRTQQLAPGFVQQVQVRDDKCTGRGEMWRKDCKVREGRRSEGREERSDDRILCSTIIGRNAAMIACPDLSLFKKEPVGRCFAPRYRWAAPV